MFSGAKFVPEIIEDGYKVHMRLRINSLTPSDYGVYKCISKNSLGDMEGSINVYSKFPLLVLSKPMCVRLNFVNNFHTHGCFLVCRTMS